MRRDSDNLAFALLARHFKVEQIAVRMVDSKYEDVYKSVGVSNITRIASLVIDQMIVNIESPELRKVISLGTVDICIFNLPEDTACAGKSIREVVNAPNFPGKIIIACVYKEDTNTFVIPSGDAILSPKDRLFISGETANIKKAVKFFA